ncbi:MAG: hypothetical protein JWP20_2875 [Roseomonas sp.]|nr:hypothetical protein [Roseomonas sp.]
MSSAAPARPLGTAELWLNLLVISALWGASFPLVRAVAGSMPAFALASARAGLAALAVGLFLWWRGSLAWPRGAMRWHILVVGTLNGWLPNILTAAALGGIESAPAALIQSATPLLIGLLALLLLREERPGRAMLAGLLLGSAGIAAIIGPGALAGRADLIASLMMLGVAASYALGTVYVRWAQPPEPALLVVGQQAVALLVALPLALTFGTAADFAQPADVWVLLVVLGVLGSAVPLSLFVVLLGRVPATQAALVGYLEPLFAIFLAALWLGEAPEPRVLAGGAVVLAGVWLATRR